MNHLKKTILTTTFMTALFATQFAFANNREEAFMDLKNQILVMAKSFEGQGDPDQSKQQKIEVLVNQLVQLRPMRPVREIIPLLAGAWKQVWGSYDYRNDNGRVGPFFGALETSRLRNLS